MNFLKTENSRVYSSVVTSGLVGGMLVAPGAVFCAERVIPRQMKWLKQIVADHVIQPHLGSFEKMYQTLHHEIVGNCNRMSGLCDDASINGDDPKSPRRRAFAIADKTVDALLAWGVDLAATVGIQRGMNKMLGVRTEPLKTALLDSTVALGTMAVLPIIAAKPTAYLNDKLAHILQKTTGMSRKHAEDLSVPAVYAGIPNVLGAVAAMNYARLANNRGRGI